jgi:hypothetical protein
MHLFGPLIRFYQQWLDWCYNRRFISFKISCPHINLNICGRHRDLSTCKNHCCFDDKPCDTNPIHEPTKNSLRTFGVNSNFNIVLKCNALPPSPFPKRSMQNYPNQYNLKNDEFQKPTQFVICNDLFFTCHIKSTCSKIVH